MTYTAHIDTFARDNLPPQDQWADLIFDLPELQYPDKLNCAVELLDKAIDNGWGDRVAILGNGIQWTYSELLEKVNQAANVLTEDLGLVSGNRVLLRGANHPMLAVTWFAVIKAGMIAVTTMPLLRAKELGEIIDKAQVQVVLCDSRFADEMQKTESDYLKQTLYYFTDAADGFESHMATKSTDFAAVDTALDDTCLIAFTSGTTGIPKATMHFHRDVMAICDTFPKSVVKIQADDICIGSPPLGFTFGLGGILLFPMRVGGTSILIEKYSPESYLQTIADFKATISWTAPFFYRKMADIAANYDLSSLRKTISAGEALPAATRKIWKEATGIEMIDGIGATELLHIFISHTEDEAKPNATGKPVPGYQAKVIDENGNEAPVGTVGRLAAKGPTGCRYLADDRQTVYVQDGWNITGDSYLVDEEGYFVYQARSDDMIITTGYNVAGPEVEGALLKHDSIAECAVVGAPDEERGTILKAYIVLREGFKGSDELVKELQDFVKNDIAPYKYPRAIEFISALPRTQTGKVQRYVLRQQAWQETK
ncbi:MAG: AMP-binding protein [Anaerolineae bacterium]|nr:AMP-binding protein [Anaerolineae bacterium]